MLLHGRSLKFLKQDWHEKRNTVERKLRQGLAGCVVGEKQKLIREHEIDHYVRQRVSCQGPELGMDD